MAVNTPHETTRSTFLLKRLGVCLWSIFVATQLFGCGSVSTRFVTGLSAEERALAARLPVYQDRLAKGSYELVGPVRGLSCQINQADSFRASEDGAMEELRRASLSAGGDAVMGVRCETLGRGQGGRSCFRSVECRGDAVRLESAQAN
jgi:uncharacterized protein YlxW (UPF0749 family)